MSTRQVNSAHPPDFRWGTVFRSSRKGAAYFPARPVPEKRKKAVEMWKKVREKAKKARETRRKVVETVKKAREARPKAVEMSRKVRETRKKVRETPRKTGEMSGGKKKWTKCAGKRRTDAAEPFSPW
jgi:hypothetical protein